MSMFMLQICLIYSVIYLACLLLIIFNGFWNSCPEILPVQLAQLVCSSFYCEHFYPGNRFICNEDLHVRQGVLISYQLFLEYRFLLIYILLKRFRPCADLTKEHHVQMIMKAFVIYCFFHSFTSSN